MYCYRNTYNRDASIVRCIVTPLKKEQKLHTFSACLPHANQRSHANAIFRQFQDAIFSREQTSVGTLTKIIFDLLQWQEIATLSLPKKAASAPFISTTFPGHFCFRANVIARNRWRVIFSRAWADIFRRWRLEVTFHGLTPPPPPPPGASRGGNISFTALYICIKVKL